MKHLKINYTDLEAAFSSPESTEFRCYFDPGTGEVLFSEPIEERELKKVLDSLPEEPADEQILSALREHELPADEETLAP